MGAGHKKRAVFILDKNVSVEPRVVKMSRVFYLGALTLPWFKQIERSLDRIGQMSSARAMQEAEYNIQPLSKQLVELMVLRRMSGTEGFPAVITARIDSRCLHAYTYIEMAQLGPSLEEMLCIESRQRKMSTPSTALLAHQMLERIEHLHAAGVVHGDVQPANWVIGRGKAANTVHCMDFHLSAIFPRLGEPRECPMRHSQYSGERPPQYVPIGWVRGGRMTWRDDLESIAYILMVARSGQRLPLDQVVWKSGKAQLERLVQQKTSVPFEKLCPDCPVELAVFLNLTRSLPRTPQLCSISEDLRGHV
jgi:serine/threonine protein kinase